MEIIFLFILGALVVYNIVLSLSATVFSKTSSILKSDGICCESLANEAEKYFTWSRKLLIIMIVFLIICLIFTFMNLLLSVSKFFFTLVSSISFLFAVADYILVNILLNDVSKIEDILSRK